MSRKEEHHPDNSGERHKQRHKRGRDHREDGPERRHQFEQAGEHAQHDRGRQPQQSSSDARQDANDQRQRNQVALAIGHQAALLVERRRHVAVLVDEFHALPAADYEGFLAELAKYGASLVLAAQSLGAIDDLDPGRGLRHAVFANVDNLFAFNCSAEDARALVPELGGRLEIADLVELGDYRCYARIGHHGERLPAFHLRVDPPPESDARVRDALATASAAQYGRHAVSVAADRAALLERIDSQPPVDGTGRSSTDPENGRLPPVSAGLLASTPARSGRKRNERRARKDSAAGRGQAQLALAEPSDFGTDDDVAGEGGAES